MLMFWDALREAARRRQDKESNIRSPNDCFSAKICTFEIYCKFIHFFDDTFFELLSLESVRYFLNNKLKRCFYMGGRNMCQSR